MSTVYKARQLSLNRIVALKALPPRMATGEEDIEQFLFEAQGAAKLKHPGIVQVYDFGESRGTYYFVMEFISGYSIAEWIKRKRVLPEHDALIIAESVAEALDYAWETERMIHCDIKPDNIMIDGDGSIKVADLGLAKTVGALGDVKGPLADIIMGTPNYVAPEQARGEKNLDCRTDIYSLGAMLYYVTTGKMPFGEYAEGEIMDRQIADYIPDPLDVNARLSVPLAGLVEIMMAKLPGARQTDWKAVLRDISHVKGGHLPLTPLPEEGQSTVRRSAARARALRRIAARRGRRRLPKVARIAIGTLGLLAAGLGAFGLGRCTEALLAEPAPAIQARGEQMAFAKTARRARHYYRQTLKWADANPQDPDGAIRRFEWVAGSAAGTRYARLAGLEIDKRNRARRQEAQAALARLAQSLEPLLEAGRYDAAADLYEKYAGAFAEETGPQRRERAAALRLKSRQAEQARLAAAQRADRKAAALIEAVASNIVTGDLLVARRLVADAIKDPELRAHQGPLDSVSALLQTAARLDETILDSFSKQRGQNVTVTFAQEEETLAIRSVAGGQVHAEKITRVASGRIRRNIVFGVDDLSMKEKRLRLGLNVEASPETALLQGLLSLEEKAFPSAADYFKHVGPPLAQPLVAKIGEIQAAELEAAAERTIRALLQSAGIQVGDYDREYWLAAVREKPLGEEEAAYLRNSAARYREHYGQTAFGRRIEPIVQALSSVAAGGDVPARGVMTPTQILMFRRGLAGLSPERQETEIRRKLLEQNPGLQPGAIELARAPAGPIVRVEINSQHLRDIGPLAGLPDLERFACYASARDRSRGDASAPAPLSSLAALGGMPLTQVRCEGNRVRDLRPLGGMPLKRLFLSDTDVCDLAPLKNAPLEMLRLNDTFVKDLSPLGGMPLKRLQIARTPVDDLTPLKDMPLEHLDLSGTPVSDIRHLAGMPLRTLSLKSTYVADLTPLNGMPLESLNIQDTAVQNLEPLRNMPLRSIWLDRPSLYQAVLQSMPRLQNLNGQRLPGR
ncbi:MAG: protein kinase [Kiritimatiellae bacterium]|nr:protein kinase [Kiritimatiellia bacterium]